jgi:hypothetical protein
VITAAVWASLRRDRLNNQGPDVARSKQDDAEPE